MILAHTPRHGAEMVRNWQREAVHMFNLVLASFK